MTAGQVEALNLAFTRAAVPSTTAPLRESSRTSERKTRRQLNDAGITRGRDLAKLIAVDVRIWIEELRVIEDVEELASKLETGPF